MFFIHFRGEDNSIEKETKLEYSRIRSNIFYCPTTTETDMIAAEIDHFEAELKRWNMGGLFLIADLKNRLEVKRVMLGTQKVTSTGKVHKDFA